MIQVAILGHGVVGSGVAEILIHHGERAQRAVKTDLNIKYILDLREFDHLPYREKFTKDFEQIVNDPEVRVVAEVMGGLHPAYDFVKRCLLAGKSVVTSNKELVAAKGAELIRIAAQENVNFLFEASVGGGIPILRPMVQCLAANDITEVCGILNGTTNFILNKMVVENMDFDKALQLAQQNGYAEKDPTADIEGHDACRKICILATLAFGRHVFPEQVDTHGIAGVTKEDAEAADRFGFALKLIGRAAKLPDGTITASVRPTFVSRERILSGVDGIFNAVSVTGDETGEVLFYGKGAGKEATASAVVADIFDCVKHLDSRKYLFWEEGYEGYVNNQTDEEGQWYVRASSPRYSDLLARFEEQFGNAPTVFKNEYRGEIEWLTAREKASVIREKLASLQDISTVKIFDTMF